jgi:integrase
LKQGGTRLEIPPAIYKTGRPHVVPLAAQARAIIAQLPQNSGPFIFSTDGGHRPTSGFSKAKARLDQILALRCPAGLRPWHVHDLRRSMATHMERIRVSPHVIEVRLGHVLKGVEGVYRHYGYIDEKADALQQWADEVCPANILTGTLAPRAIASRTSPEASTQ